VKRRESQAEAPGQDSFLDVVANLVGILIILVMLVASQAQRGFVGKEAAAEIPPAAVEPLPDVAFAMAKANDVEQGIVELNRNLAAQNLEMEMKARERARLQLLVTVAEQRLAEHRDQLSSADKLRFDLQSQLTVSAKELQQLEFEQATLTQSQPGNVIPHLPTPMAKTVFGSEIHFRLLEGKITYLPWDETIEMLKADFPKRAQQLMDQPQAICSLPVVAGFSGIYLIRRYDVDVQTRIATARQVRVGLDRFYFKQVEENLGETVQQALRPGSQFRSRLAAPQAKGATVTLWVYPDSFEDFRAVKQELFRLGFLTAGRPLPAGYPIGGAPDGTRSSAE